MSPTVLITRPEPAALHLADQLRARWSCGVRTVISPVMQITWSEHAPDLLGIATLIFTSQHGVEAFTRLSGNRDLPCYAVGEATAEKARAAGFHTVQAQGDANALLAQLTADRPDTPCLHIRGNHVAMPLAQELTDLGIPTSEEILYNQVELPLSSEALNCLSRETPVILPLYSPRSAKILFSQIEFLAPLFIAAISTNVAKQVSNAAKNTLLVAERPDAQAMFEVMDRLQEKAKRLEGAYRAQ